MPATPWANPSWVAPASFESNSGSTCQQIPPYARRAAVRALGLSQELGNRYTQCRALVALAAAHQLVPNGSTTARASVDQALALAWSGGYRILEGQARTRSAEIWLAAGDPGRAAVEAEQALAIHRATGHRPGEARTHALLGRLGHGVGDTAASTTTSGPSGCSPRSGCR